MGHIRVDLPNTNNKWVGFGLANVNTFIIRVGFGLTNVDTIRTLTRYEHDPLTRIATHISISAVKEKKNPSTNHLYYYTEVLHPRAILWVFRFPSVLSLTW